MTAKILLGSCLAPLLAESVMSCMGRREGMGRLLSANSYPSRWSLFLQRRGLTVIYFAYSWVSVASPSCNWDIYRAWVLMVWKAHWSRYSQLEVQKSNEQCTHLPHMPSTPQYLSPWENIRPPATGTELQSTLELHRFICIELQIRRGVEYNQ